MSNESKSAFRLDRSTIAIVSIVLAIVLFLSINIISNAVFRSAQLDLTQDALFTVSDGTREILSSLDEPVTLKFYRSELVQQIPTLAAYATRVEELLERYADLAGDKVKLEKFAPEQFSVEEDQAVGFGIQGVPVSAAGEVMYFGLAGTNSTDDEDIIPFFTPSREAFLEYDLSKLVFNLSKPGKTVVAMISSLPIAADQARRFAPWVAYEQAQQFFDIRIIGGNVKRISDETDLVLLVQPTSLSQTTMYAIDQFVMRGGKALIFADPHVEVNPPPQQQQGQPYTPPRGHALGPLLDAWGIEASPDGVVGDRISAQRVAALSGGRRVVTEYLPWMSLGPVSINREDVVTRDLERINLIAAGRVGVKEGASLTMTPLLFSSEQSQVLDLEAIRPNPNPIQILTDFQASGEVLTMAGRFTGPAKSAFPDGPPPREDSRTETGPDPELVAEHLGESDGPINAIVVADADLLADQIWMQGGGGSQAVPVAQNGDLFVNMLDNLAGSASLIGLRGRGLSTRPFTLVDDIRRDSELQFRSKERDLLQNIEDSQRRIADLQQTDEGQFILSAEQQKTISDLRRDIVRKRAELREVQHALQEDIDRLDATLKVINIGAIPLLIALVALVLFFARRVRFGHRIRSTRGELAVTGGRES
jgi:ABC-type uncharacterized transport system involved in gliding motility auxiliary subunit